MLNQAESQRILSKNLSDWNCAAEDYHRRMHTAEMLSGLAADPSVAFEPIVFRRIIHHYSTDLSGMRICVPSSGDNLAVFAFALLGARVTSCDFSPCQLEFARTSASRLGLENRILFQKENSMALPAAMGPFDLIYTSRGVWVWLEDLHAHCSCIASLLDQAGRYIACDVHPAQRVFDESSTIFKRYDDIGPFEDEYNVLFHHRTQDIVNALADSGLMLTHMQEIMFADSPMPARLFIEAEKR